MTGNGGGWECRRVLLPSTRRRARRRMAGRPVLARAARSRRRTKGSSRDSSPASLELAPGPRGLPDLPCSLSPELVTLLFAATAAVYFAASALFVVDLLGRAGTAGRWAPRLVA